MRNQSKTALSDGNFLNLSVKHDKDSGKEQMKRATAVLWKEQDWHPKRSLKLKEVICPENRCRLGSSSVCLHNIRLPLRDQIWDPRWEETLIPREPQSWASLLPVKKGTHWGLWQSGDFCHGQTNTNCSQAFSTIKMPISNNSIFFKLLYQLFTYFHESQVTAAAYHLRASRIGRKLERNNYCKLLYLPSFAYSLQSFLEASTSAITYFSLQYIWC